MASPSEIAALEIRITGVEKAISQFSNFQQTTTKTMSSSEAAVTRSLKNMAAQFVGVAAVARAVQNVVSSGVGFNQFVENTTTSFTVMMKSAEKAKAQMKDLYDFAVNSPLTFKESAASSKQLMAYGFAAEELVPTMRTLGSVAIATGHSLDDISYVYGTLKSQGRAYSRDLMQFGMRGIPIYEELAKVMSVDVKQIQKMASEGKIGFAEVEQAFQNMTTGSGRFSGVIEGYMTTLTGKLSMLGDIAQQSAGNLMSGVTDGLKSFVDQITKSLSAGGMQSFIEDMSALLGGIVSVLGAIIVALATILPVIGKIMKALIPAAAVLLFLKTLTMLPAILMAIGAAATTVATGLTAAAASMTVGAAASSALAFGSSAAASGITALSASLKTLALANPWLLALIAIAAAGGAVITILSGVAAEARASPNENVRARQLEKDFAPAESGPNVETRPAWLKASEVQKLAEEYKLAEGITANILINSGALSRDTWQQYLNTKSVTLALQEQDKVAKGLKHTSLTIEQEQAKYFAGITGYSVDRYYDPDDTTAFGRRAANDYIAAVQATTQQQKDLLGSAFMPEDSKKLLEDELKSVTDKLQATLSSGLGMADLEKSGYLQGLRDYIEKLQMELDGFGKKAKELTYIDLSKWWTPLEQAAKRTASGVDDINVATAKSLESAEKEYDARMEAYRVDLLITADVEKQAELIAQRNKDTVAYKQLLEDITAEGKKQANVTRYAELTGQSATLFTDLQAGAGKAFQDAIDSVNPAIFAKNMAKGLAGTAGVAMQGTEAGEVASGFAQGGVVGLIATIAAKFISLLSSIENVGKSFNALTTIWEEVKTTFDVEGMFNNAFKPIVQHLEQLGKAIGGILPVFVGLIKMANALVYIVNSGVLISLQLLGKAFTGLYNSVIVPFGNGMISVINGVIGAINNALGWSGVHIEYLDMLEVTSEALKDLTKSIENQKSALDQTIDYLTDKINDAVDKQLDSLKDLYEVGAITATDYEKRATGLSAQKIISDNVLVSPADKAITDMAAMYSRLVELYDLKDVLENTEGLTEAQQSKLLTDAGLNATSLESAMKNATIAAMTAYGGSKITSDIDISKLDYEKALAQVPTKPPVVNKVDAAVHTAAAVAGGNTAGTVLGFLAGAGDPTLALVGGALGALGGALGWFDVGTGNLPNDQMAMVHKGEGIIPATFMDSIRSGELMLSGGGNEGTGQVVNVYVNVEGSVQTENDLAATIARNMHIQRRQGALTV